MLNTIDQLQADNLFCEISIVGINISSLIDIEYGIVHSFYNGYNYEFYFSEFKIYKIIKFNDVEKNVTIVI